MILPDSYSEDWINFLCGKREFRKINPPVFEKMIYALILLEKLVESGLDFIFKGGTSLVLLIDDFRRFSIDIDIITTLSQTEIKDVLTRVVEDSVFESFNLDEVRSKPGNIPKAHYNVFYNSKINQNASVTLDILFEQNPYPSTINKIIECKWVKTSEPYLTVKVPDIDSILGDKLTAFAPNTIGVPYYRGASNMSVEIIKQLFDIGTLIPEINEVTNAYESFISLAENQIKYRNLSIEFVDVYDDIFQTSLIIARRERNTHETDKAYFQNLQQGITSFNPFLTTGSFRIEDAIIAAGKATWLMAMFKAQNLDSIMLYDDDNILMDSVIVNQEFQFLNRLKRTNKEAFYYWYKALELLELH